MIWFSADYHFYHANIIGYCGRPFRNHIEMNNTIVSNYLSVVKPEDEVYFLGDLTMFRGDKAGKIANITQRLPGTKHLILGNHDDLKPFTYINYLGFTSVHTSLKLNVDGEEYYLIHDPAAAQIPNTKWICGHVHNLFRETKTEDNIKVYNCGVDVHNFYPVSLDEVKNTFNSLG